MTWNELLTRLKEYEIKNPALLEQQVIMGMGDEDWVDRGIEDNWIADDLQLTLTSDSEILDWVDAINGDAEPLPNFLHLTP